MKSTTIVMLLASIFVLILGIFLLVITKVKKYKGDSVKFSSKYIIINAKFNIGLGVIGIILSILHNYLINLDNEILILFIIIIFIFALLQKIVSKKYIAK